MANIRTKEAQKGVVQPMDHWRVPRVVQADNGAGQARQRRHAQADHGCMAQAGMRGPTANLAQQARTSLHSHVVHVDRRSTGDGAQSMQQTPHFPLDSRNPRWTDEHFTRHMVRSDGRG